MHRQKVTINKNKKKSFANSAKKTHSKNIKTTTAREWNINEYIIK